MNHPLLPGLALTLVAGLMSGNCMLPLKFIRRWPWENSWLAFSLVSLLVLPWAFAFLFVHHLFAAYGSLPLSELAIPMLLGAGWGIAQILFGISVRRLGLGIAYAIIVGLGAALGTLVPFFAQPRAADRSHTTLLVLAGVLVMAVGIALTAWGGQLREKHSIRAPEPRRRYAAAVVLAILCGIMAPMLNYSFAFGQQIAQAAVRLGNSPLYAAYAVWPIGLIGGLAPNVAYSLLLLRRNGSWSAFQPALPDVGWSALMGFLWMGAFALYGMSATYLGALGTSVGWGLLQIFMILTATLSGVITGEWKQSPVRARLLLGAGLIGLCCAITLLGAANA